MFEIPVGLVCVGGSLATVLASDCIAVYPEETLQSAGVRGLDGCVW